MSAPVLKVGARALLDCYAGLVPVVVLSIKGESGVPSHQLVRCRVLENFGGYKEGAVEEMFALWIIPPKALKRRQFSTTIGPYTVECSEEVAPPEGMQFRLTA